jgi:AcrR family transcriptional regulator
VPQDERPAVRRAMLVDAAFHLLGTEGDAATTVRAVCQRCRLNPRYFYESFADRDELLLAVYDQQVERLGTVLAERLASVGDDEAAFTRVGVDTVVRFAVEDPRRARVLYTEALGNEALARRRLDTMHDVAEALQALGRQRHGPPPAGETIGPVAASLLVGGLSEVLLVWLDGRLATTVDQLVEDATELFLATTASVRRITEERARSVPERVDARQVGSDPT